MNYEKARKNLKNVFSQHEDCVKVYKRAFFVSMLLNVVLVVGITMIGLLYSKLSARRQFKAIGGGSGKYPPKTMPLP